MDRRGSEWFDRSVVANRGPARGAAAEWSTAPGRAAPFVELAGMLRRTDARLDFLTCFGDFSRWINRRSRSSSVSRPIGRTQARGLPSAGRAPAEPAPPLMAELPVLDVRRYWPIQTERSVAVVTPPPTASRAGTIPRVGSRILSPSGS